MHSLKIELAAIYSLFLHRWTLVGVASVTKLAWAKRVLMIPNGSALHIIAMYPHKLKLRIAQ